MSATVFIEQGKIVPQADFQATEGENGSWTGSQTFWVKKGALDDVSVQLYFSRGKKATELDPNNDQIFDFLYLKTVGAATSVGGWTVIPIEYQGFVVATGNPPTPEGIKPYTTYSLRGVTKSVAITEHPKFKALTVPEEKLLLSLLLGGEFKLNLDGQSIGQWVAYTDESLSENNTSMIFVTLENPDPMGTPYLLQSDDSQEFGRLISEGKTDYEVGTFEYWVRWSAIERLSDTDIAKLGLIDTPVGDPPTPTGGTRDWRLTTVNQEQEGTENPTYAIELGYILSDEGGFDTFLYTSGS
jgi:hypothetical protein